MVKVSECEESRMAKRMRKQLDLSMTAWGEPGPVFSATLIRTEKAEIRFSFERSMKCSVTRVEWALELTEGDLNYVKHV